MKRYVLLLMLLACCAAWAQNPDKKGSAADTADTEENVIGGRPQYSNRSKEANVLGTPVYYNRDGSVRTPGNHGNPRGEYQLPEHHWRNTLGSHFNTYFCEAEAMIGDKDVAVGMNFTYLPERWGMYGSMLVGERHSYLSLGPTLRFSDKYDELDWQLYGGVMIGDGVGGEFGMRIAGSRNESGFGWCSGSMGVAVMDGRGYMTLGLSLEITAIAALSVLLFTW